MFICVRKDSFCVGGYFVVCIEYYEEYCYTAVYECDGGDMRIVFMGTPQIAASVLSKLAQSHEICAVYTRVDKPSGRGHTLQYSPVKEFALAHAIPLEQPKTLRAEKATEQLASYKPDCIVVVAYGMILPEDILSIPPYGAINVHASLLPAYRGAAPIQRALFDGVAMTGVTIMQMDAGLDTGAMLLKSKIVVSETDTTLTVMEKMAEIGARALLRTLTYYDAMRILHHNAVAQQKKAYIHLVLEKAKQSTDYTITDGDIIEDTVLSPVVQDETKATLAPKITKEEYLVTFDCAQSLHYALQALTCSHNPSAYAFLEREGTSPIQVKLCLGKFDMQHTDTSVTEGTILELEDMLLPVVCKKGTYFFTHVRPESKKTLTAKEFYQGYIQGKKARFTAL